MLHERDLAWPGLNVYADERDRLIAFDMEGEPVREWRVPGRSKCRFFRLLEDDHAVAMSAEQGVTRVDADSEVVWRADFAAHHDLWPLADGGYLVPSHRVVEFRGRNVRFDELTRVDEGGELEVVWSSFDRFESLHALIEPSLLDEPGDELDGKTYDYFHLNSVNELPATELGETDARFRAGNLLLCFRNVSLVCILDRESHDVVWHWGPGELDFPHMPQMLETGRILLFDNGWHRGWSRVIELDPVDSRIAWTFQADPPEDFFTKTRGSCQRLPNGNTLVCESERGRAFEVTREGEIVWEWWSPGGRLVYRLTRSPR